MNAERKVCIITGGGSGVGKAAAVKLAKKGFAVVLVGRTASKLEAVKAEIEAAVGTAAAFPCDVGDYEAVRGMVEFTLKAFGRVDVLVNNAGHSSPERSIATMTPESIESVLRTNLVGPMYCSKAVLPHMLARKEGTIVNVSSLAAYTPGPLSGPAYGPAKAGLVNFNRYLNNELRNTGVRACCILPGEIDTPVLEDRPIPPSKEARTVMLSADDVAEAIVLAATLPPRALVEEIVIRPTMVRDRSREMVTPQQPLLDL